MWRCGRPARHIPAWSAEAPHFRGGYIYLDGAWAVKNRGGHDRTMLSEDVWQVFAMLATAGL